MMFMTLDQVMQVGISSAMGTNLSSQESKRRLHEINKYKDGKLLKL